MKQEDEEAVLIQRVFGTPDGEALLALWVDYHVYSGVQHENSMILANRVGKLEFVTTIVNALEGD